MGFQLSPGISVSEIDLTTIIPAVGTTVGAIAGPFRWGPAFTPRLIDSELTLVSTFGKPDNATANNWFTAANFLAYANALQTVRVVTQTGAGAHKNATADGSGLLIMNEDAYNFNYSGGQGAVGMFAARYPGDLGNSIAVSLADADSFGTWPYKLNFEAPPGVSTVVSNGGGSKDEMHIVVVDSLGNWTGTPGTVLERFPFVSKCVDAKSEDGSTIYYPEVVNRRSAYIWWMDHPADVDLGQSSAVNWGGDSTVDFDTTAPKLTLTDIVGDFTVGETVTDAAAATVTTPGTGATATALASAVGSGATAHAVASNATTLVVTIDTPGTGYTVAPTVVLSGGTGTYTSATPTISSGSVTGITIVGASGYTGSDAVTCTFTSAVRVAVTVTGGGGTGYVVAPNVTLTGGTGTYSTTVATVSGGAVTGVTVSGQSGYTLNDAPTVAFVVPGSGATATVTVDGNGKITAVTPTAAGSGYLANTNPGTVLHQAAAVVTISGPGSGANIIAILSTVSGHTTEIASYQVANGGIGYTTISAKVLDWTTPILTISGISGAFVDTDVITGRTSSAHGTVGTDGVGGGPITIHLAGGIDGNPNLQNGDLMTGFDMFKSAEDIDISLVLGADADSTLALYLIDNIAEFRLDCVAFLSPPKHNVVDNAGSEAEDIVAFRNLLPSTSYAVMDSGWKYQYDKYADIYRWVPLNGDIAGLCVNTDNVRDPWWSPAGYNRGFIKNVVRLAWNPRKAYRDLLYMNSVNPVITDPGQGTLLFGDKTMLSKPSAFDRINVRRLFIVLEKAISTAAKFTLFEFNDQFTRAQFVNMVEPFLADVKGRRGIFDFRVVCDSTNNTPEVIDSNRFIGDIYVKPARSINFIQLNFVAVRTGVDFSEIVGKF